MSTKKEEYKTLRSSTSRSPMRVTDLNARKSHVFEKDADMVSMSNASFISVSAASSSQQAMEEMNVAANEHI